MNRTMLLKVFTAIAIAFAVIAFSAAPSQAAGGGSFSINTPIYSGCNAVTGYVSYSGLTAYDSNGGAPGDNFGIVVDAILPDGTFARWTGQSIGNTPSGTIRYSMSWGQAVSNGSNILLLVLVYDAATGGYIGSPNGGSAWQGAGYSCTTSAPPPGVSAVPSYYVPDPNKGYSIMATVKVNTPVYASPTSTSATAGNLTAGQTWFIVGTAHNRTWYQVFVGGPDLVWVPASTMSPMGKVPTGKSYSNGDGTFSPAAGANTTTK